MTENKNILLITYDNYPFGGAGANLLRLFSKGLMEQNIQIQVWLPTGNYYGNDIDHNLNKDGIIDGINYKHLCFLNHPRHPLGKIIDNLSGLILPFFYLLRKTIRKEIDIIIIYNTSFFRLILLLIIKRIFKKELIVIIPEFYEKPDSPFYSSKMIKWYNFYFGIKYLTKYADKLIVLSHYLKQYFLDKGKEKEKILVMPNLTDPDNFNYSGTEPFINNKITIGYAGTPVRKDGINDLINSFYILHNKYPNTHLLIIGDVTGKNSILSGLKSIVYDLNLEQNVTFTGLVPSNKVSSLLNACQILALTRPNGIFAEAGFPTKLGEYFACRKPVVISKVGDIQFYFKDEEHVILIDPGDIHSIVNGFERLILNGELAKILTENAYNWMEINLNYHNVSKRIYDFLIH